MLHDIARGDHQDDKKACIFSQTHISDDDITAAFAYANRNNAHRRLMSLLHKVRRVLKGRFPETTAEYRLTLVDEYLMRLVDGEIAAYRKRLDDAVKAP